jgi:hypothetical protein
MSVRVLAALTVALLDPAGALAGALAPAKASDLVVVYTKELVGTCPNGGRVFDTRVLPDGTEAPFVIPPKRVLVITSLEYSFQSNADPNWNATPLLSLQNGPSIQPILRGFGVTDALGSGSGQVLVPAGVAVRAGPMICISAGEGASGVLQGFFAKDK